MLLFYCGRPIRVRNLKLGEPLRAVGLRTERAQVIQLVLAHNVAGECVSREESAVGTRVGAADHRFHRKILPSLDCSSESGCVDFDPETIGRSDSAPLS